MGDFGERDVYFRGVAQEIEAFLLHLEGSPDQLFAYVKDRLAFLNEYRDESDCPLSDGAKAVLLESNYSVIKEVMKHRDSQALRWVCVWLI
jgi:hypothetical protein